MRAESSIAESIARLLATAEPIKTRKAALPHLRRGAARRRRGRPAVGRQRADRRPGHRQEPNGRDDRHAGREGRARRSRWPRRPAAPPSGWRSCAAVPASTIHRLLGAQARQDGEELSFTGGFARGADEPLDEDVVVVDEASMLDAELAEALLRGVRRRDPPRPGRRRGPAALDRAGTGARRRDRRRRRADHRADHPVSPRRGRNDRAGRGRCARRAFCPRSTTRRARSS